jgi:hypothetical protein
MRRQKSGIPVRKSDPVKINVEPDADVTSESMDDEDTEGTEVFPRVPLKEMNPIVKWKKPVRLSTDPKTPRGKITVSLDGLVVREGPPPGSENMSRWNWKPADALPIDPELRKLVELKEVNYWGSEKLRRAQIQQLLRNAAQKSKVPLPKPTLTPRLAIGFAQSNFTAQRHTGRNSRLGFC